MIDQEKVATTGCDVAMHLAKDFTKTRGFMKRCFISDLASSVPMPSVNTNWRTAPRSNSELRPRGRIRNTAVLC